MVILFLMQKLTEIDDDAEARKHGFPKGTKFKLLNYDFTLLTDAEWAAARAAAAATEAPSGLV
jgi:hypothetical protein